MSTQQCVDVDQGGSQTHQRSRFNAVTHGLTAKTAVLPGEALDDFRARISRYKRGLEARNEIEDELAERAAVASWRLDRAERAEVAQLISNIHTEPEAIAFRAKQHATLLGQRLFFDRRGPIDLYPSKDFDRQQPRTSAADVANDPDDPTLIVQELESFPAGCEWLRERWGELRELIETGLGWQSNDKLRSIRLLGRQPLEARSVRPVAEIFLACHVIEPQFAFAFQELRCDADEDRFKRCKRGLSNRELESLTPADATAARAVLLRIVDKATARLRVLEAQLEKVASVVDALRTDALSFDPSKAGEQLRRHIASCNRLLIQNIDAIHRHRRNEASGWGRTKHERERRKQTGRLTNPGDQRLVLDDRGKVRTALGYEGDLEKGLARYAAEIGPQHPETIAGWEETAQEVIQAVPDYARWVPPAVAAVEPERVFEGGDEGAQPSGAETLLVAEQGEGANIKNKIARDGESEPEGPVSGVIAEGREERGVGRRDDHVDRFVSGQWSGVSGQAPGGDASVKEMIDSIKWLLPRTAEVVRDHVPRSP